MSQTNRQDILRLIITRFGHSTALDKTMRSRGAAGGVMQLHAGVNFQSLSSSITILWPGNELVRNNDARDAKKLQVDAGDTLTLSFDCEECSFVADVAVYLVDRNIGNRDIANGGDSPVIIEISQIDCFLQNCHEPFDVIIPNDLDTGKYKIVIDRDEDEGHYFYINRIRILEGWPPLCKNNFDLPSCA